MSVSPCNSSRHWRNRSLPRVIGTKQWCPLTNKTIFKTRCCSLVHQSLITVMLNKSTIRCRFYLWFRNEAAPPNKFLKTCHPRTAANHCKIWMFQEMSGIRFQFTTTSLRKRQSKRSYQTKKLSNSCKDRAWTLNFQTYKTCGNPKSGNPQTSTRWYWKEIESQSPSTSKSSKNKSKRLNGRK